jgi:hypothetical protein
VPLHSDTGLNGRNLLNGLNSMTDEHQYEEGKRAGLHPFAVILGVIAGLWLFIWLFVPNPKSKQGTVPEAPQRQVTEEAEGAPVMFRVAVTVGDVNAVGVLVPAQATNSQVAGLLKRFRDARLAGALQKMVPATTPGHKLGDHAVADIFVFSDPQYANADSIKVLARGAHAPGELYPQAIPFEVAMEQVRGHYRIDLNNTSKPDTGSLGFADESGVHSKHYRLVF